MSRLRERYRRALFLSVSSLFVFLAAEIVSFNREAWFGIEPGYAPHNFSFNLAFYLPMMFVSTCLAVVSVVFYIRSMLALRRNGMWPHLREWATILPVGPIAAFAAMVLIFIIRA